MSKTDQTPRVHRLGDLQLKIMQTLWERGEATVAQVLESLTGPKELAYTTIATMLRKMEARALVAHREEGRSFVYRALVAAQDVSRGVADHLVDRLFEGSLTEAVNHLLTTRDVSRAELNELERLIREKRRTL
ncbi:MAG: BlaI/MecI/CopY family transcriptional regulator [Verrucomicrobia bacterium]|nr:BlaI/MecI/CopY family transcriptional regulator [Verrucomicrobiota bacterium]